MENDEMLEERLQRQAHTVLPQLHEQIASNGQQRIFRSTISTFICSLLKENDSLSVVNPEELLLYMKKRGFIKLQRSSVMFKTVFLSDGGFMECLFPPAGKGSSAYYVCQICSRGFTSLRGLGDHQRSASHVAALEAATASITFEERDFRCPLYGCNFCSTTKEEVVRHLKQEKSKSFDPTSSTAEHLDAAVLWTCTICSVKLPITLKDQHCGGKKHRGKENSSNFSREREGLLEDKGEVKIELKGDGNLVVDLKSSKILKLMVKNISETSNLTLEACDLTYDIPSVILSYNGSADVLIPAKYEYELELNVKPAYTGITLIPVIFTFRRSGASFKILDERSVECVNNSSLYSLLQPTIPYEKPKRERTKIKLETVKSDFFPDFENNSELLMPLRLSSYHIPDKVKELLRRPASEETIMKELNLNDLDHSNYSNHFNDLLHLEEFQQKIDIRHYTMHDVMMRKDPRNGHIKLVVPGLAENRPSVLRGDHLYAIPSVGMQKKYQGHVHSVQLNEVSLGFAKSMRDFFIDKMKYKIEFTINRFCVKLGHRAVLWAGDVNYDLQDVLFPRTGANLPPLKTGEPTEIKLSFFSPAIGDNNEQKMAVQHIVCGTSRPAPYLIYGPPGTGKTFTMVEAIKQVYREFPKCRILACAPQNAAADLIAKHLRNHIDKADIYRVNASSRSYIDLKDYPTVQEVSNYRDKRTGGGGKEIWFPAKEVLAEKRVIVATLVTSGRFVSAEMTDHFTHIFVDEAGHATEPDTVIPLAGLLNVTMSHGGQVVLAGDPKQLGPVIRSTVALHGGLGVSLLERLMSSDVYKRDPRTGTFNSTYVTKLVQSFRSHPDILKVPNECFYDAELRAYADKLEREKFCSWEGLPTTGFPLIFHGVNGLEQREESSPSWFNINEVDEVQKYVRLLMDSKSPRVSHNQIGIISPYHQQVKKVKDALVQLDRERSTHDRGYNKIKVGSVEKFQGDEKQIIIITTVRSQEKHMVHDEKFNLGFVKNPKRFNVAVTRAKALLIVIGNPAILGQDPNWGRLIQHINAGGGCTGCPLPENLNSHRLMDELNLDSLSLAANHGSDTTSSDIDESSGHDDISAHMQHTNKEMNRTDG